MGKGTPIVLLHGWGGSSASMASLAREVSREQTSIFTPDLPGFGNCPPPERPWDVDDYARWIRAFLEDNRIVSVVLVGHSFGGHVAARFAKAYGDRVEMLILLAPSGIRRPLNRRQQLARRLAATGKLFGLGRILSCFAPIVYWIAGERDYLSLLPVMRQTMQKVMAQDIRLILDKIKTPTLIIWGRRDRITPVQDAEVFSRSLKHAKLVLLEDAKHGLPMTHPAAIAHEINVFLQKE